MSESQYVEVFSIRSFAENGERQPKIKLLEDLKGRKETAAPVWVVWFIGQVAWVFELDDILDNSWMWGLFPIGLAWDTDWKDSVLKMFYGHCDEKWVCAQYVFLLLSPLQTNLEDGFHAICFCVICFLFIC